MMIHAKRWRGQHFLTDTNMLKKIVSAADIQPTDTVVEIGAGTGNLTVLLAEKAKRVIAIEIDNDLIPALRDRIAQVCHSRAMPAGRQEGGNPVVEVIHDDARTFDPSSYQLQATSYLVVANIPYNITSLLIRRLLEADTPPSRMILLVQKEVAQRICAVPPHMSMLSVAVQYYATPRIMFSVPRTCFSPRPHVDSAVLSFRVKTGSSQRDTPSAFFHLLHAGFAHKRKLLLSNLASVIPAKTGIQMKDIFTSLCIPSTARAQELSLDQWRGLCFALFPFSRS